MDNQNLIIEEEKNDKIFFTKEEISELTGLSQFTFNNWVRDYKPDKKDIFIGKQNRRAYSKDYLEKVFNIVTRPDLIELINNNQNLSSNKFKIKDKLSDVKNEVKFAKLETKLEVQNEIILLLKERIRSLEAQIKQKDSQIENADRSLNQQQVLSLDQNKHTALLLEYKKTKNIGFFSWFRSRKEEESQNNEKS